MAGTAPEHLTRTTSSETDRRSRRLRRLGEELEELGLPGFPTNARAMILEEVDWALRPEVHERFVPSGGTVLEPTIAPERWSETTELEIARISLGETPLNDARRFVDGLSSWLVRSTSDKRDEWLLFDRPAGSERDLVVLAEAMGAVLVQRHPSGAVRIVGEFGVLRWDGLRWHHEPPVAQWLSALAANGSPGDLGVLEAILRLAVYDLGALGVGALLVQRPGELPAPGMEEQLSRPPPLLVRKPFHLGPIRHALAQVDGAAVFDAGGVLRLLGVRLVPTRRAERELAPWRGTRHTSALRYSYDDPSATVVVVSESGPISVLRAGAVVSLQDL